MPTVFVGYLYIGNRLFLISPVRHVLSGIGLVRSQELEPSIESSALTVVSCVKGVQRLLHVYLEHILETPVIAICSQQRQAVR